MNDQQCHLDQLLKATRAYFNKTGEIGSGYVGVRRGDEWHTQRYSYQPATDSLIPS